MWNVFDASFIIIFLLYIILRIKGLATGDGESRILERAGMQYTETETGLLSGSSSEFGFDILACGACILFPR